MERESNDGHEFALSSRGERQPHTNKSGEWIRRRDRVMAYGTPALAALVVVASSALYRRLVARPTV